MIKKLLREGIIKNNLSEESIKLFEIVKDYYVFSGDIEENIDLLNELSVYLREEGEDKFDPLAHAYASIDGNIDDEGDVVDDCVLSFSNGNKKLDWPYLSLPAGYTCPFATSCKNFASKPGQKFKDGKSLKAASDKTEFMCYAASQQARFKDTNKRVFSNLKLLQDAMKKGGKDGMAELIIKSIIQAKLENVSIFRIHESGDFFTDTYFKAWIDVCKRFPKIRFYTHTTSLKYWLSNKTSMPRNMNLTASMDKNNEKTILENDLRYSRVVYSVEEAGELNLPIDIDDRLACCSDKNFAILIHGTQPAGSDASKALMANKKGGIYDKIGDLHKATSGARRDLINKIKKEV